MFFLLGLAFYVSGSGVWAFRGTGLRAKSLGCGVNGAKLRVQEGLVVKRLQAGHGLKRTSELGD